jgi:flagellum-specific peptidoglycan hydrolase FlgJ
MLRPKVQTIVSREDFVDSLLDQWVYTQGRPSLLVAAVLFAQYAFETGWGKYCFNYNLGNVRAFEAYTKNPLNDWFELPGAWEIVDGKRVVAGGYFRSHESLDAGMAAHLAFLAGLDRYRLAFQVLQEAALANATKANADSFARRFVRALKAAGYFTGDATDYENGASSIAQSVIELLTDQQ